MRIIEITSLLFEKYIAEKLPTKDQEAGDKKEKPQGVEITTWIGPNANTWDPAQAQLFRKMEKLGYSKEKIFSQTGTIRMNNGKLAQEINDKDQTWNPEYLNDNGGLNMYVYNNDSFGDLKGAVKLGDLLDHPGLFNAYPQLKDTPVILDKSGLIGGGSYNYNTGLIKLNVGDGNGNAIGLNKGAMGDILDTLTHEIGHAIQHGPEVNHFSKGGNPASSQIQKIGKNIERTWSEIADKEYDIGDLGYYSLDGEGEAENANNRKEYTDKERAESYPSFNTFSEVITIQGNEIPQHIKDKLPPGYKSVITKVERTKRNPTGTYISFPNPDYKRIETKIINDYIKANPIPSYDNNIDPYQDKINKLLGIDTNAIPDDPAPIPAPPEPIPEPTPTPAPAPAPKPTLAPKPTPKIKKPTNPGDRAGINKPKVNPNPNPGIDATTPIQQPAKLPPSGNANIKTPSIQTPPVDRNNPFQMYPDNTQSSTTKPGGHGKNSISTHPEKPPKVNKQPPKVKKQPPGKQANERK